MPDAPLTAAALGLLALVAYLVLRRANELFAVRVVRGRITTLRGRPPKALLAEWHDVLAQPPPVERAVLRVTVEGRRPMLRVRGELDAARLQRLRNVLGLWPLAKLRPGG
ncbi:MAG TPA: DUF3634 family protein [Polyangiaceae bacterium]|nr:DUF3634 family protein [Polyangiaceae bacterium]